MMTIIFAQNADLLSKKIIIENSLREKISFAIEKIIDPSQFVVIVNTTLGQNIARDATSHEILPLSVDSPATKPNIETEDENGYSAIPGLPALPTQQKQLEETDFNQEVQLLEPNVHTGIEYSTIINRVDVTVYLEEAIATAGTIKDVGIIIRDVVPQTQQCTDCIRFETMRFKNPKDKENSTITELVKKIEELEQARLSDERERKEDELLLLKAQLKNAENARVLWESEARQREINRQRADSLKLAELVTKEKTHQEKRDSLLEVRETEVREVIQERLNTEAKYAERSFDLLEKQLSNPQNSYRNDTNNSENGGFTSMGMQYPQNNKTSNWWLYLLLGLAIIALLVISLTRKPKTVYLKPKNHQPAQTPASPREPETVVAKQQYVPQTTTINDDEDVLRSELKSVRQTAVSMSVGQKDNAANIVRNWLDDTSDSSEDNADSQPDEKEEKSK